MTLLLILQLVLFLLLLIGSGFFSSAETALFSFDRHEIHRIAETEPQTGDRLQKLLNQPTRLLSTLLIGNTMVNINLWIVGVLILERAGLYQEWLQVGALTLLTLLFGEFGPKRFALRYRDRLASFYARYVSFFVRALRWPRHALESITSSFSSFFLPSGHIITRAEYDTLMEAGDEGGELDEHEHKMVQGILSLERQRVSDVMTPRVDLEGIDLDDPDVNITDIAKSCRVRYLVLYREQLDSIEGLLDVRAYLLDPSRSLERAWIRPFFVPELCSLDKLLTQMLTSRQRVAVAVDEYGGTAGLITRGDILEELTGEMDVDEDQRYVCEQLTNTAWLLDGQLHLLDIERITGLPLESETADRLSGWFIEQAERLPKVNDRVEGPGYKAMVRQMRRNRILLILLERVPVPEDTE